MSILITNPDYDTATHYLSTYNKEILEFCKIKGEKIFFLKRPSLTKVQVESIIKSQNPKLILLNGHGNSTKIFGDKIDSTEEPIIIEEENHHILNKRITYARSCWSAMSLGRKILDGCFVGYNLPFSFWTDETHVADPWKDKIARNFLEPSNALIKSLIKGNTAKEAANTFKTQCSKNILRLLSNKKEPGTIQHIKSLWMNMSAQEVLGNENLAYSN